MPVTSGDWHQFSVDATPKLLCASSTSVLSRSPSISVVAVVVAVIVVVVVVVLVVAVIVPVVVIVVKKR